MANYKTYTTDPILGKIEKVSSDAINAENLTSQKPIILPTEKVDDTNYLGMLGQPAITTDTTNTTQPEWWTKYMSDTISNPVNDYNSMYSGSGIDEKTTNVINAQKDLEGLNAQLKGITDEATKQNLELEGSKGQAGDVTQSFLNRQQQETNRQAAIKALPLQAQILAKQAVVNSNQSLLTAAQQKLDKTFELQQSYQDKIYNYNKEIRDRVYDYATKQEQAKLDAQQRQEDRDYEKQQSNFKNAQSIASEAMANGQADIASQITALDPTSENYTKDLAKLQAQIKNPTAELDLQLKRLQIAKAQQDLSGGGSGGSGGSGTTATPGQLLDSNGSIIKLTPAQSEVISGMNNTIDESAKALKLLEEGVKTGPVANINLQAGKTFGLGTGGEGMQKQMNLEQVLSNIKSNYMKAISGVAVGEKEVARLSKFLPDISDQESVIKSKLESLSANIAQQKKNLFSTLGAVSGGESTGNVSTNPVSATDQYYEDSVKILNANNTSQVDYQVYNLNPTN